MASKKHKAGYSTKSLAAKLGIGVDTPVLVIGAPRHYAAMLDPLPPGARIVKRPPKRPSFVHVFSISGLELACELAQLRKIVAEDGVVWVSWPKKASRIYRDLDENIIRDLALPLGFVDVKVCAIDEVWSGLKLVIRRELRARQRASRSSQPRASDAETKPRRRVVSHVSTSSRNRRDSQS